MLERFFGKISLERLCIVMFISGIILLFFIVILIEPVSMNIYDISEKDVGKTVSINASVKNKILRNGNLFLELQDIDVNNTDYIKAVMFEDVIRSTDLSNIQKDSHINVVGKIDRYNNELEIVIEKINIL